MNIQQTVMKVLLLMNRKIETNNEENNTYFD